MRNDVALRYKQTVNVKKTFTALLVALLAVAGCNKPSSGGDTPTPTPTPDPDPTPTPTTPYFKATIKDSYLQGPDDTGISIMLETNMQESEWTVETDADWIVVTKKSNELILVPNTIEQSQDFPAPREGSITLKAGTVFSKTFKMIQEAWTRINAVSEVSLNPSGDAVEISVSHNCYSWSASCDASWLTVKKQDTSTLIITSSARGEGSTDRRSAVVKLVSDRDSQTFRDITVSDAESNLGGEDYNYGDHTDWD